jgi:hypothetical protein
VAPSLPALLEGTPPLKDAPALPASLPAPGQQLPAPKEVNKDEAFGPKPASTVTPASLTPVPVVKPATPKKEKKPADTFGSDRPFWDPAATR